MNNQMIDKIEQQMMKHLDLHQQKYLHDILCRCMEEEKATNEENNLQNLVKVFLAAKRVEGCSEKTVRYYDSTIRNVLSTINKDVQSVTTDDLRMYLDEYQKRSGASKVTIDNIRRILSSFFHGLKMKIILPRVRFAEFIK